ncbi:MAG: DUF1810 family protein [Bacteroidales bacterium]|nr:DUF1810 family protein [Bacteroidales bacterium]
MLGSIIGDIAGSVYEFKPVRHTDFLLLGKGVNYTDDTITAMAVADWGLNSESLSHADLEERLVKYAFTYPCPLGGYGASYRMWLCNTMSKREPYGSFGNGSAMRVASIGWLFDSLEETERIAELSASITHDHPEGLKGAMATAAAIFMARTGSTKSEIKEYIQSKYGYDLDQTCDAIRNTPYKLHESCQETLPGALVAFLESTDFESSIRLAVSLARDSDTLACINGGIAEAFYKEIPAWMKDKAYSLLPQEFVKILNQLIVDSAYGSVVRQDPFCNMQRFLDAQSDIFGLALFELESGKKKGDWDIHLLFPTQDNFKSSEEIEQYLSYPLLKRRIELACSAIMKRPDISLLEKMSHEEASIVRDSVALFNNVLSKLGQEQLRLS